MTAEDVEDHVEVEGGPSLARPATNTYCLQRHWTRPVGAPWRSRRLPRWPRTRPRIRKLRTRRGNV